MFKCGGLTYTSTLSKFSWLLCWYSCNFRESENNVRPPELASWPPRMKKDEVLDILAVSECRIIPATCRSWSFFEPMLMIYLAQWNNLWHIEKSAKFENCSVGIYSKNGWKLNESWIPCDYWMNPLSFGPFWAFLAWVFSKLLKSQTL